MARLALVLGLALVGCGARSGLLDAETDGRTTLDEGVESAPDAAPGDGLEPDTAGDAGHPGESGLDAGVEASDAPPCPPLPGDATHLYVDRGSTGSFANGSPACPWKRITDALYFVGSPAARRIVHVRGGTPSAPTTYDAEPGSLHLYPRVTLLGDGPSRTRLTGYGAIVVVEQGAVLDGFAVETSTTMVTASGDPPPGLEAATIKNVTLTSLDDGIHAYGAVLLGPGLVVTGCGGRGVLSVGGLTWVAGSTNAFDRNADSGLVVGGGARLVFEGGTANDNGDAGVRLDGRPTVGGPPDLVQGLVARNNGGAGLDAGLEASVYLRGSTLLRNRIGLRFRQGTKNLLDLGGTTGGAGKNQLGSATTTARNRDAAVCIEGALPGSVSAHDDLWSSCGPGVQQVVVASCAPGPAYADVWFQPAVSTASGPPLVAPTCSVGP